MAGNMNLIPRWFRSKKLKHELPPEDPDQEDITPFELDVIRNDLKDAKDETEQTIKKIREKPLDSPWLRQHSIIKQD